MTWLTQNWICIVVAIGGFFLMTRMHGMGGMGGCGGGHGSGRSHGAGNDAPAMDRDSGPGPGAAFDAVSGHAVTPGDTAASTVFRGQAYYFESRENRDAFERDPDKYLAATPGAGRELAAAGTSQDRPHRRHGC